MANDDYIELIRTFRKYYKRKEYACAACVVAKHPYCQSVENNNALDILTSHTSNDLWQCINKKQSRFNKEQIEELQNNLVKVFLNCDRELKRILLDNGHLDNWVSSYFYSTGKNIPYPLKLAKRLEHEKFSPGINKLFAYLFCNYSDSPARESWLTYLEHNNKYETVFNYLDRNISSLKYETEKTRMLSRALNAVLQHTKAKIPASKRDKKLYPAVIKGFKFIDELYEIQGSSEELSEKYDKLCMYMLKPELLEGRSKLALLNKMATAMPRAGKAMASWFGIKDVELPSNKGVMDGAPKILTPSMLTPWIDGSNVANNPFEKIKLNLNTAEQGVIGGFLSASTIWEYIQIDPNVIKAIDFSYTNEDSWAGRVVTAKDILDKDGDSLTGALHRLNGYTAEQQVAMHYSANGYIVDTAETANEEGWDLIIDGQLVQVKNTMTPSLVQDALNKNPDIPVITNIEMQQHFENNPMVWPDPLLVNEQVADTTLQSLETLEDLNFSSIESSEELLSIPLVSVAFAMYRNRELLNSSENGDYIGQVSEDVIFRSGGALAAGTIATYVGSLLLGPVGGAGAGIIFSMIGHEVGATAQNELNNGESVFKAREEAINSLSGFATWFAQGPLDKRLKDVTDKYTNTILPLIEENKHNPDAMGYLTFVRVGFEEMILRYKDLIEWIVSRLDIDDFSKAHAGWAALQASSNFSGVALQSKVENVKKCVAKYNDERGISTSLGTVT